MPQQVQGVIARSKGAPVELVDITIPDPGPNDVVVRIQACGVCHTDLTYRDGGINDEFPFLLGHEAAGVVESAGSAVTHVEVGDFVVLNWRAVCGNCRACRRGRPWYCFDTFNASQPMTLTDGTELTPALGIGAFADKTLVHEGPMHQGRPERRPRGRRPARLRCDGRSRRGDEHRQRLARGFGRGDRLRRSGRRRDRRSPAGRRVTDHRHRPRSQEAAEGNGIGRHPHDRRIAGGCGRGGAGTDRRLRRRRRRSTRSAARKPGSRRSMPATSPAPSYWSACRRPT